MYQQFSNRCEAGRRLANALSRFRGENPVVLALPRGGVPVGHEIARLLAGTLDVFIVRHIRAPRRPELVIGALASGGIQVLDKDLICTLGIPAHIVDGLIAEEAREVARREARYGAGYAPPVLRGRTVILAADGLATGRTMLAAVQAAKRQQPARIIVAAPVATQRAMALLEGEVDEVACLRVPEFYVAAGLWYESRSETSDDEIYELLGRPYLSERLAG